MYCVVCICQSVHLHAEVFRYSSCWAWYAFYPAANVLACAGESADQFCLRCLSKAGVLLLPGSQFDDSSESNFNTSFRVGYGRENMSACLDKLDVYLSSCEDV